MNRCEYIIGSVIGSVAAIVLMAGCSERSSPMPSSEIIISTNVEFNARTSRLPLIEKGPGDYFDMHDNNNTELRNIHSELFKIAADDRTHRLVIGELPPVKQWELVAKWWQLMDSESKRLGIDKEKMLFGYDEYVSNSRQAFRNGKLLGIYTDKDIEDICDYLEPYMGFRMTPDPEQK